MPIRLTSTSPSVVYKEAKPPVEEKQLKHPLAFESEISVSVIESVI